MRLRRFRSEDGEELLDLPRAPLPDPETPAPVRLLPTWDATLLAHARRTGVVPEEHKSKIFNTKMPQSVGTFLVDGVVAGTWRFEDAKVRLEPFEELHRGAAARVPPVIDATPVRGWLRTQLVSFRSSVRREDSHAGHTLELGDVAGGHPQTMP